MKLASEEMSVKVPAGKVELAGDLTIPGGEVTGIVAFAHGSGSSRKSPRNRYVASRLHEAQLATLLLDLLTEEEDEVDEATGEFRFDVGMLGQRLMEVVDYLGEEKGTEGMPVGLFGASTGAAAALIAAANRPREVKAVVSRGGRPDLAGESLPAVKCPVLLIVGGHDHPVIELNEKAVTRLGGAKEMLLVPRATHLFEEPGALEQVATLAAKWFRHYLGEEGVKG